MEASSSTRSSTDPQVVIAPSLVNPDWDNSEKFVYNPDFDLGMSEWLYSQPAGYQDANAGPLDGLTVEMILDAADPCEQSTVTVASRGASVGPNPKRRKLSLSSQKKPMYSETAVRIHIPVPLGEVTNHPSNCKIVLPLL